MGIANLAKTNKVNTVLGIDASTNSVAFCYFDKNGPVRWGEIVFKGDNTFERLADGQSKVAESLAKYPADLIVFESAVFVQNKKTVVLLAYAFGAIVAALTRTGTKVEEIPPMTWQHAIGNKPLSKAEKQAIKDKTPGKSDSWYLNANREFRKKRTMDWVEKQYGIVTSNDNVSDAIAIASVAYDKFAN